MIFFLVSELFFLSFVVLLFLYFLYILVLNVHEKSLFKYNIYSFFKIYVFLGCFSFFYLKLNIPIYSYILFDLVLYNTRLLTFFECTFIFLFVIYFFFFNFIFKDFLYFFEVIFLILNVCFLGDLIFFINDFFLFFILFEGLSLSIYILAMISLLSLKTAEAGLKYFLYGVFVSIFLLISFLGFYYLYGTSSISKIIFFQEQDLFNYFIFNNYINKFIYFSSIFFFLSCLLFKIGLVPFHLQVIDVYSSVILSIFYFFLVITKYLFSILLFKLVFLQFKFNMSLYFGFFYFCGFISILISSIGAINELNVRKILAQSSINHMGFLILLCSSGLLINLINFVLYLYIYIILLIFFLFIYLFIKQYNFNFETLYDLTYLFNFSKYIGFSFCFIFFMMSGLPPFIGFWIKQLIFYSVSLSFNFQFYFKFILLVILLLLNVVNIYIYLRFVIFLFSENFGILFFKFKLLNYFIILFLVNQSGLRLCKILFNLIFNYIFNFIVFSNYIIS